MKLTDAVDIMNGKMPKYAKPATGWPTPTTQEIEHPEMELTETGRRKTKDGQNSHSLGLADKVKKLTVVKGQLNPQWVECLQGFPQNWTETGQQEDGQHRRQVIRGSGGAVKK